MQRQSSDNLIKLKTLLDNEKLNFWDKHGDLKEWSEDRNLQIEHFGLSDDQKDTTISSLDSANQLLSQKISDSDLKEKNIATTITNEEYESVIDKMTQLLDLPHESLDEKSQLYFEQQLADMLGFDVSAELENNKLKLLSGTMQAQPHLKRSPTDTLDQHSNYNEALMGKNRSAFGWLNSVSPDDQESIKKEEYYFCIPLYALDNWSENYQELKKWYKHRKMVMINPAEKIAVVGVVGNIGPTPTTRRHFGGSPEVIREGRVWSPKSGGKVLMFFVDDPKNKIELGAVKL
jgi:hypothetical protein